MIGIASYIFYKNRQISYSPVAGMDMETMSRGKIIISDNPTRVAQIYKRSNKFTNKWHY
jgi:hypothetical protein